MYMKNFKKAINIAACVTVLVVVLTIIFEIGKEIKKADALEITGDPEEKSKLEEYVKADTGNHWNKRKYIKVPTRIHEEE